MIPDYIKFRIKELGLKDYAVRIKILNFEPEEEKEINTHYGEFWIIDNDNTDFGIILQSDKGFYGRFGKETNETVLEHSGAIEIENILYSRQSLQFWQVLDLSKDKKKS
ncbi:hypothetical protein WAF17_02490 [Bernardetia sp. ABR2-2B]|uniref:hypothetical protein n=1 Tax=Bernardetia sp. ABR2-2B TaxID=3127472 RepID=UPI0030D258CC